MIILFPIFIYLASLTDPNTTPDKSSTQKICVMSGGSLGPMGKQLANKTGLSFATPIEESDYSHVLEIVPMDVQNVTTFAVGLRSLENRRKRNKRQSRQKPFFVDFSNMQTNLRNRIKERGPDLLIKAVAPGKIPGGAIIYDLTAGFGQDSFLLALAGASQVCMVERDPIVATLLQDGLRRLAIYENTTNGSIRFSERISCEVGDGTNVAKSLSPDSFPHVTYLDPMFPPRAKSAAVKKNMQLLHDILGSQQLHDKEEAGSQEVQLLQEALRISRTRVVVKRPIHAPPIGAEKYKPSYDIRGSINRWDVYVIN